MSGDENVSKLFKASFKKQAEKEAEKVQSAKEKAKVEEPPKKNEEVAHVEAKVEVK